MRHRSAPYRLALAAATFVAAAVASYAQTALPVLTRELYLQANSVGNPLIQISAPSALGPAYSMILPPGPGNVGDVLTWSASTGALVWEAPSTGSWALLGNTINPAGTGPGEVFLGTRNEQPLILATTNTTTPQPIRFLTNNTERIRILGNGNVGIGTSTPSTLLDVAGTFRATGNSSIGGTLTLTSVAQGVAGDSVLLINASNEVTRTSRSSLIASMGWALTGNAGTTASQYLGTSDAQPLSIRTDGVERMRILSTGQIGVGVANPTSTLDVSGTLTVNTAGGAATVFTLRQANPAHTNAFMRAEQNDGTTMYSVGNDGSLFARGPITFDALGGTATTPLPAGYNRILIANASGQVEESAINDVVAEGVQANAWGLRGNNATTDAGGTVGQAPDPTGNYLGTTHMAGLSLVTDSIIRVQISSLGDMSVQLDMRVNGLTLGKGGGGQITNTALGIAALRDNTTGERNTAMGNQSLMVNRFGSSNTSVGASSQSANFAGSNNTSFGSEALASIVATDNNVAVGAQSLYAATGSDNTAVGHNGLRYITVGNGNLALGSLAGTQIASGTELLSATNSIFIGNDARANASGQSNQIVIGNGAIGLGTNSVVIGNATTESTRLRGRLGIGANPTGGVGDAQVQVTTATAASKGLTVRGVLNQTGNLFELQDSLGNANVAVTPNGSTTIAGTLTLNGVASGLSADSVLLINASNQVTRTSRAALFAGSGWALTGNANTSVLNYLGTSDLQPLSIRTNGAERIRISTDGKTGIGVSSPVTRLHVGNGALLMDDAYEDYDSNAVLVVHKTPTADATLNDPLPLLYLAREGTLDEAFAAGVEMSLSRYEDVAENSRTRFDIALANGNFLASKNTVMTMRSAGFVGINNTAPTVALDITGGLRATGTVTLTGVAQGAAADSVLLINASNQVTRTSRASLFAENGWALAGNTFVNSSGSLGATPTGTFLGSNNTYTGAQDNGLRLVTNNIVRAIISRDGQMSTQQDIVVNGVRVGRGPAGYDNNTVLGAGALASNNLAQSNVAIGKSALSSLSNAINNNIAIGDNSLNTLNGGSGGNVAIGTNTIQTPNATTDAVAIGFGALRNGGDRSVAIGSGASNLNMGADNVAIGFRALNNVNGNGANVAVGAYALETGMFGQSSVGVGYAAGKFITNGTTLNESSDFSVFIGRDTKAQSTAQSNQIVIGFNAIGLGSNSAVLGNSSITATRLQGRVGIGANPTTAAGDAQLQVTAAAAANRGLTITGAPSQSANLIDVRDNLGASMFTVNSSGNVAINNPVAGGSTTSIAFGNQGSGHGALLVKNATLGSQIFDFYFGRHGGQSGAQLRFWRDQATEVMRIMGTGEVGIGVFPPTNRLDVGGTFRASGLATLTAGATITGATTINTTGNANTTIGSSSTTGTTTIATNGTSGRLVISGLPTGSTDDILLIDASNQVSRITRANFLNGVGPLYFDESLHNAAPNDIKNAVRWQPKTTTTNVDIVLSPLGNGALLTRTPDGTTTGGDKRGNFAVDLQIARDQSTAVASANFSSIGGGRTNTASGVFARVGGGYLNSASGQNATVGGGTQNSASALSAAVAGGEYNVASADYGSVLGGSDNRASGQYASVLGGYLNEAAGIRSTVLGGTQLTLSGKKTAGYNAESPMTIADTNSFVLGSVNLWLANNDNRARELRFYEAQSSTGAFPATGTNYTAFKAGVQSADITYTLPTAAGSDGQVLVTNGASELSWTNAQSAAGIKSKGRSAVLTAQSTFVITGLSNVDTDDGVSIVLESDNDDMDIPPYFIKRVASPTAGSITVRFSAPFTGYVTWVVVD